MVTGSDEPLAVLAGFGLSGYQARAYLALLELGPAQAREVSERSGVPQGRVYDILEKLHQRGLAEVLPEAPRRYRAVPFEVFLERELQMHRDRVGLLERERGALVDTMQRAQGSAASAAERGEYVVVRGRKAVLERIAGMLAQAQRDALAIGTARSPHRVLANGDAGADLVARGVHSRLLVPVTPENATAMRECMELGIDTRHHTGLKEAFPAGLNVLIVDGQRAFLYQHIPDDLNVVRGEDVGLFMEHPEIVRGLGALAETLWTIAMPATERLDELARGEMGPSFEPTVLIVDDEPDILQSFQELLQGAIPGLRLQTAASAQEGVEVLRKEPVDLIISDYKLPGMNGLEFLLEAGKLAPGSPRILITAFPDLKIAIRAINEAGVEHFLTKPFQPRQVVDLVRLVLARRAEQRQRDQALARAVGGEGGGSSGGGSAKPFPPAGA